jgi:hypothetical protein
MIELLKNPWKQTFLDLAQGSRSMVQVAAPFVKQPAVRELIEALPGGVALSLVTSFKLAHYHAGASDLDALSRVLDARGRVFNHQKLHAKIYLFDRKTAIVSSGNLTQGGLVENYEYGVLLRDEPAVGQVVADFEALLRDPKTGQLTADRIEEARRLLAAVPPLPRVRLPNLPASSDDDSGVLVVGGAPLQGTFTGWKRDVFEVLERIPAQEFTLQDLRVFENDLQRRHPENRNVAPKIRQQLQLLRDNGLVEFVSRGRYRKLWA